MAGEWDQTILAVSRIADTLRQSQAPAIYGLWGLSLEEQRVAFRLAEALGAYISVTPRLSPTLTAGAVPQASSIILVGDSSLPAEIVLSQDIPVVRCDALGEINTWPYLHAFLRGRITENDMPSQLKSVTNLFSTGEPALIFRQSVMDPEIFENLIPLYSKGALFGAIQWENEEDALGRNAAGAYEIALEEAGGAASSWSCGRPKTDRNFDVPSLCNARATDLLLRLGESPQTPCLDGISLIHIGPFACPPEACDGIQSTTQDEAEYTVLRPDGIALAQHSEAESPHPSTLYVLQRLLSEVKAC
ncbi:MAG TPA: hypothetical protein VFC89_00045 [Oscillospiraceae bacterium]|nr:hypothetical protein [Oscillospiraceae bacterium]